MTSQEWPGLDPVPARVLVKGASSTVWVAPPGGPRTDQTFPWWLEIYLRQAGLPAWIRNAGKEGQNITDALCDWDREVQQWSPDVVVLNYGQYEAMPGFIPQSLERHATTTWHRHSGRLRERYRQRVLGPLWRTLAGYQRDLDARTTRTGPFRASPERAAAELERYITQVRLVASPLVLVMDTWPLSERWRRWFPGMDSRARDLGERIKACVVGIGDDDVRLVRLSSIVGRHDPDEALPDGVHFSADLHREIALELVREIVPWASGQPHLRHAGLDLSRLPPAG